MGKVIMLPILNKKQTVANQFIADDDVPKFKCEILIAVKYLANKRRRAEVINIKLIRKTAQNQKDEKVDTYQE